MSGVNRCIFFLSIVLVALVPFLYFERHKYARDVFEKQTPLARKSGVGRRQYASERKDMVERRGEGLSGLASSEEQSQKGPFNSMTIQRDQNESRTSPIHSDAMTRNTVAMPTKAPETPMVHQKMHPEARVHIVPSQKMPRHRRLVVVFTTLFDQSFTAKNKLKNLAQINTLKALAALKMYGVYSIAFTNDQYWRSKAKTLGINRVRSIVSKNQFGTPFLYGMLRVARMVKAPFHCYINGDILLGLSFVETLETIKAQISDNRLPKKVFIIGRRYNFDLRLDQVLPDANDITSTARVDGLMNRWVQNASVGQPDAFDWFVFSKGSIDWENIPKFVIGRISYDNCIAHIAVEDRDVATIDATLTVRALHQTDSYGLKANKVFKHKDYRWNEDRCWKKRNKGWIMYMEHETRYAGTPLVAETYGYFYDVIPTPTYRKGDISILKRKKDNYKNMVITRENKAVRDAIKTGGLGLYTLADTLWDAGIDSLAKELQYLYVISFHENCTRALVGGANIIYACHPLPPKPSPKVVWDNKEKAPANPASPWGMYSIVYASTLETWANDLKRRPGQRHKLVFDGVVLKGRANPQLAVFLLLFGYLHSNAQTFLCCTRPYLRNVHYNTVGSFFKHAALHWETKMGLTHLQKQLDRHRHGNLNSSKEIFRKWLVQNNFQ